jgi:glycosyltransferase involved in cell wall biosynthesis
VLPKPTSRLILAVHQGFPAQFEGWIRALIAAGHRVVALHQQHCSLDLPGLQLVRWQPPQGNGRDTFAEVREVETKFLRAAGVAVQARKLAAQGLQPDLILAHPGWGETLYLSSIWPKVPQLHYLEHFYTEAEVPGASAAYRQKLPAKNVANLLALHDMALGVSPTRFQAATYPELYQPRIEVVHDGLDLELLKPRADARVRLANGRLLQRGDPVVTFVNRTFEPYRGFPQFMRALPALQRRWPDLQVLLIGHDRGVSYGCEPPCGRSWKQVMLDELAGELDLGRLHFVGKLERRSFVRALQLSACHVYLTVPFVLSWSCLEAMACGAPLVASNTAPVREVASHGREALLVSFDDAAALADAISACLDDRAAAAARADNALQRLRETYDQRDCTARRLALSASLLEQTRP